MIKLDYDLLTVGRGELSDVTTYNELQALNLEDGSPLRKIVKRRVMTGNRSITIEYYELKDGWSFKE